MKGFRRYAVYYAPPAGSTLARTGSAWLGWDAEAALPCPQPDLPALPQPVDEITGRPRHYGFHATLKAPFRLAAGRTEAELGRAVAALALRHRRFLLPRLRLADLGDFLALVPEAPCPPLDAVVAACVIELDHFRAPMSPEEHRRRSEGLSPLHRSLLERWGYPHVLEAFQFHMTLTGPLPEPSRRAVAAALDTLLAPAQAERPRFAALSLFGEPEVGPFRLLRRCPLGEVD